MRGTLRGAQVTYKKYSIELPNQMVPHMFHPLVHNKMLCILVSTTPDRSALGWTLCLTLKREEIWFWKKEKSVNALIMLCVCKSHLPLFFDWSIGLINGFVLTALWNPVRAVDLRNHPGNPLYPWKWRKERAQDHKSQKSNSTMSTAVTVKYERKDSSQVDHQLMWQRSNNFKSSSQKWLFLAGQALESWRQKTTGKLLPLIRYGSMSGLNPLRGLSTESACSWRWQRLGRRTQD